MSRKPKKDESLEVRLPHETKQAFMERCKAEGRTASEAVRVFIEAHLARPLIKEEQPKMRIVKNIPFAAAASAGVIALAFLAASPSHAGPDLKAMFKTMDANGDGKVTAAEFAAPHQGQVMVFRQGPPPAPGTPAATIRVPIEAPKDFVMPKDGALPFPPGPPPTPEQRAKMSAAAFSEVDADKNGDVTFEEFAAHHEALIKRSFAAMDQDHDGKVSAAEFAAPPLPPKPDGQPHVFIHGSPEMFKTLDANKDGAVSEAEFIAQG